MKEDIATIIVTVIFFSIMALAFWAGHSSGYSVGEVDGRLQEREDVKKINCIYEFSNRPFERIPGKCLKYFYKKGL